AGYIFTYNLPTIQHLGLDFYGTTKILILGYLAGALPSTTRLLVAPVSQVQSNIADSARVHGSKKAQTWLHTQLPLLAQPILWAWLLTFAKTVLELPISQLLYAPSQMPISVAINKLVAGYEYGTGTAMSVVALFGTFLFIALALGIFRLVAPKGWRAMDSGFIAQGDK
ncbi:MAG: ABC transporter permease subunit, partial [Acidimicrobiales bacterium]